MAKRFCSAAGSNTAPYDTWAKAATSFTTIFTGAAAGDIFVVDVTYPPSEISNNTTWTFSVNCSVIASTNSGVDTITPTPMDTLAWLGSNTTWAITLAGASKVYFYGITLRVGGTISTSITVGASDGAHYEFENCYLWAGSTGGGSIATGNQSAGFNSYALFKNCTFRFATSIANISFRGVTDIVGGSISSAGTVPSVLIASSINSMSLQFTGTDLSPVIGTLVGSQAASSVRIDFVECRFAAGVTVMAAQTNPTNKGSARVSVFDCASGDTHGLFGYYDAFGSLTSDTGIYLTDGAAAQSWKLVTTANCGFGTPFVTPWISLYNTATVAITPRLEILRNGSLAAYTDAQVWGEFSVKDNSGFTNSDTFSDRQALVDWAAGTAGAALAAGVGTGSWTGGTTPWSGKVDSGGAITPAESGHIRARVAVGAPSITVYVDPQIRT